MILRFRFELKFSFDLNLIVLEVVSGEVAGSGGDEGEEEEQTK